MQTPMCTACSAMQSFAHFRQLTASGSASLLLSWQIAKPACFAQILMLLMIYILHDITHPCWDHGTIVCVYIHVCMYSHAGCCINNSISKNAPLDGQLVVVRHVHVQRCLEHPRRYHIAHVSVYILAHGHH